MAQNPPSVVGQLSGKSVGKKWLFGSKDFVTKLNCITYLEETIRNNLSHSHF
jgi:hypothetical protein